MDYVSEYHTPVLLHESVEALNINPDGIYVDCTFGGGGHSLHILKQLSDKGTLMAFDQDEDALKNKFDDKRLILVHHNFKFLNQFLDYHHIEKIDGLLVDLGISSLQIDDAERGFAHRFDADLDMRMSKGQGLSAKEILNTYSLNRLTSVLREFGELKNAYKVANAIVAKRASGGIKTTGELNTLLQGVSADFNMARNLSKVYQAIRIEVNGEIEALKDMLLCCPERIKPGGSLVIISYHSIEDRIAKNFLKTGNFENNLSKDFYGNIEKPFTADKKVILPSKEEMDRNTRARSAKMRRAKKN